MANRIKGITVEIGGDTTKLQTALKGVNGEIKNTQAQLRDVEKLLKLDPGNTELLAQKHKLLGQAVEETKGKLTTLKTAAEQANTALANGEISQEQYDALQREIIETENNLKKLEEQANQSATAMQKIAATGEKLKTAGDNISSAGKKMLPVTAAVTGLGTAAVTTAANFESSMSQVQATMGITKDSMSEVDGQSVNTMDTLSELAKKMGAETAFSASECAEALNYLALAGYDTQQMCDTLPTVLNLAAAGGTHLRNVILSLQNPTDKAAASMKSLGVDVYDSEGNMRSMNDILGDLNKSMDGMTSEEKSNIISNIFNKTDLSSVNALLANTGDTWDDLQQSIANSGGAAQQMADTQLDNLQGQLTILKSALEGLAISFGELLMPAIKQIVGWVQKFVDWLNGMDEGTKKVVVTVALFAAALGPVLIIVGKVISAVGTIMTVVPKIAGVINTVKGAFAALNVTMLANPIFLIIAAITALVAAFIYLWNTNEDFRQFWIDLWENIKEVAIAVWNAIKEFFVAVWEGIKSVAETVWNGLRDFFTGLWEGIKNIFTTVVTAISTFLSTAWNTIKTVLTTVFTAIQTFFTTVWNTISTIVTTVVTAIQTFLTAAWNAIKTAVITVLTAIQTVVTTVWNAISTFITTIVTAIQTFLTTAWNTIKTVITTVLNAIKTMFTTIWNAIKSVITTVVNGIKNTITSVWNNIKSTVSSVVNGIKSAVSNAFSAMYNGIKSTISGIYNTIKSGFDKAVGYIKNLASSAFNWGKDLVMGIVNGIRSCISAVGDAVSSVADKIKSFLHFSVPDEGPLTDYESWMPDFMSGLAKGIEKSKGMVASAMDGVAADMVVNPKIRTADTSRILGGMSAGDTLAGITTAITEALAGVGSQNGDIVIPVYLGGTMLDEVVVNAQQRTNLRSGGR